MSRYLLDTHIFIWLFYKQKMLSRQIIEELEDYNNTLYISRISLMEIAIKNRNGNLILKDDYAFVIQDIYKRLGIRVLEIDNRHLITLNQLTVPKEHRDPFDHLIISQAITDRMCLISADTKMKYYTKQGLNLLVN